MTELLQLTDIRRDYAARRAPHSRGPRARVQAVSGIDLTINTGETLGIVGESGCGKSTLARMIVGLEQPSSGTVSWRGRDVTTLSRAERRTFHQKIQLVFQDPHAALNPRHTVRDSVAEGIRTHHLVPKADVTARISELLLQVGLGSEHLHRYPHELSGGQLQRVGIARALAVEPELLVCDEPVSALDISIQAQVLNLLRQLTRDLDLAIVFIAHDLDVVQHMSDRIVTMYLGKVVESGECSDVYGAPAHPYTRALMSAVPRRLDPGQHRDRIVLEGDPPSPIDPPSGCSFHPRCYAARPECATAPPELHILPPSAGGSAAHETHTATCHFAEDIALTTDGLLYQS